MEWQFSRTYTDENGVTRIEELTFEKNPELKTLQAAKGIRFNVSRARHLPRLPRPAESPPS